MKNILQKITIISACLALAFFIFVPGVWAAGCCQIYYKLDKECDQHKDLMTAIKNSSPGLSDMEITCLINNFPEIEASDTGDSLKDKLISKIQKILQDNYQQFAEVGTDYLEDLGEFNIMLGSEHFNCVDGYINDCRIEADTRGVITFWSTEACDPTECEEYNPATNIPAIQPTNPVCWPQAECEAVCKTGNCWTGQADECAPGRGYCLADRTDVELGVNIAGVGRVSDFGSYIALLYNYLIGVIVIVAVVMMMYGGFRWITAGGSPERISEAKKTIASAIIGLMLGLFSYTILNIINPATLELELPRIKRIRPIYFEVDKMRCEDYETPAECEANPNNFSVTYDEEGKPSGGCVWSEIGFGKKCIPQDFTKGPGYPGNLCLPGNECNEGKCVKYDNVLKTYQMNPTAESTSPEQNLNWCTNGEMDMPCKYDTDCDDGFKCDERLWACVGTNKGRPLGAECDEDSQCASAFCDEPFFGSGTCKSGRGGTTCTSGTAYDRRGRPVEFEGGECNDSLGYKCVKFIEGSSSGYCCDLASAQQQGNGCYTGCTSDSQCGDDMYCWRENATLVEEGGEATEQRPIAEWSGVCFEKGGSGDYCFYDSGCESGLSCAGYQSLSPADSAYISLFRAPGSESSPIILPPGFDRIRVGRCQ